MKTIALAIALCYGAMAQTVTTESTTLVVGGSLVHPTLTNTGTKTVIDFALRRNTTGYSPVFWFAGNPIKPGETVAPGLALNIHKVNRNGDGEGTVVGYEVIAAMYSNGRIEGRSGAVKRLEREYQRMHDPVARNASLANGFNAHLLASGMKPHDGYPYPGNDGTPIFAYSGDMNYNGLVLEGQQSPVTEGYAFCFNGPFVTYGYKIGAGLFVFNDGICGDLHVLSNAQELFGLTTYLPFKLQQVIAAESVFNSIEPAYAQQYEGCDFGGNDGPGLPSDEGLIGDPWVQVDHDGYCTADYIQYEFGAPLPQ